LHCTVNIISYVMQSVEPHIKYSSVKVQKIKIWMVERKPKNKITH